MTWSNVVGGGTTTVTRENNVTAWAVYTYPDGTGYTLINQSDGTVKYVHTHAYSSDTSTYTVDATMNASTREWQSGSGSLGGYDHATTDDAGAVTSTTHLDPTISGGATTASRDHARDRT